MREGPTGEFPLSEGLELSGGICDADKSEEQEPEYRKGQPRSAAGSAQCELPHPVSGCAHCVVVPVPLTRITTRSN